MLLLRLLFIGVLAGIAISTIFWIVTGNRFYRRVSWNVFLAGLLIGIIYLLLFALERLLTT